VETVEERYKIESSIGIIARQGNLELCVCLHSVFFNVDTSLLY
jgi:hypothetical protein